MLSIRLETAAQGDVLDEDVVVNDVILFASGTLLTTQRLDILKSLGVKTISIVERSERRLIPIEDLLANIDRRFSYVETLPHMKAMKDWVKEIVSKTGGGR